jgi:hypothetical protein
MAMRKPTTSSITILGLSLSFQMISARPEAHKAKEKVAAVLNK